MGRRATRQQRTKRMLRELRKLGYPIKLPSTAGSIQDFQPCGQFLTFRSRLDFLICPLFFLRGRRFCTGTSLKISEGGTARPWESCKRPSKETLCSARSILPIWLRWKSHISASFSWERRRSIRSLRTCLPNKTNALSTLYRVFRQSAQIYSLTG